MAGISLLSQLNTQLSRFETLNAQFSDLQRALSSNKKTTTYSGLGNDALSSLRYRTSLSGTTQYVNNIDISVTRMKIMNTSMGLVQKQTEQLRKAVIEQPLDGVRDINSLQAYASKLMEIMPANLNEEVDGRYVFAGSDISARPYSDTSKLEAAVNKDVAEWLDGTITTDTFLSRVENYTDDQVGFTPEVLSSGNVHVNADENYTLDYTFKASDDSIKQILVVGQVFKSLRVPEEGVDAPSADALNNIITAMAAKLDKGAKGLEKGIVSLQAGMATVQEIRSAHKYDQETYKGLIEDVENVDPTETAVKLQNVQLQLEASYRVAAATASLTLLNYLD